MSGHKFPGNLSAKSSAVCENGCDTVARQLSYTCNGRHVGVGDVEYFVRIVRTGPRTLDYESVWTTKAPPCEAKS